jgi:hypothetical protein
MKGSGLKTNQGRQRPDIAPQYRDESLNCKAKLAAEPPQQPDSQAVINGPQAAA